MGWNRKTLCQTGISDRWGIKLKQVYYSRVDWWLVALMAGSLLFCVGLGIYLVGVDRTAALILFGIVIFSTVLVLLLVVPCKYTLLDDHLLVQSGVIRYIIPYTDIRRIEKSSNPLSSPALSLRRVKIARKKGFLLVSPTDRDKFIKDLSARLL